MLEPFHRTQPDDRGEYDRYFLVEHPDGPYVRHEHVILRVTSGGHSLVANTTMIDVGDYLVSQQYSAGRSRLQALLEARSAQEI